MVKEIKIIIDPDGNISIDTNGFTGDECIKATEDLEKHLGIVKNREKKPEFKKRIISNGRETIRSVR